MQLSQLDLNLLVAFEALYEHRNVTRAARHLSVSQSALSHTLGRMRHVFDDPLFVRAGPGVVPTTQAESLYLSVAEALASVRSMLSPSTFDPNTTRRRIVVATTDMLEMILLPALSQRLAFEAPGLQVVTRNLNEAFPAAELRNGSLDLVIAGYFPQSMAAEFCQEPLYAETFVCVMRKSHPLAEKRLTRKRYLSQRHLMFTLTGDLNGPVDAALAEAGDARDVRLALSNFASAGSIVSATDMLLSGPGRLAMAFCQHYPLVTAALPFEVSGFTMRQHWHQRTDRDPCLRWLRSRIVAIAGKLSL